ncbi:MAG: hypothetical protein H6R26_2251, partial [Proteobacteria bacterium]|nr:hypothetical protein [Pseudomonadota bacterium]
TTRGLLDEGTNGATGTWANPATKNSGVVKILFSYKDGNLDCRRTGMVFKAANGMTSKSIVNLCSIDGRWRIKEWPAQAFNDADWKLFDKTAQEAMENVKDGGTKAWKNEKTGNAGVFELIATEDKGGRTCRTVNISITTRQFKSAETTLDLCKNPQGVWKRISADE